VYVSFKERLITLPYLFRYLIENIIKYLEGNIKFGHSKKPGK
jgi:hypothetical protein